jgi:hypothetical protein
MVRYKDVKGVLRKNGRGCKGKSIKKGYGNTDRNQNQRILILTYLSNAWKYPKPITNLKPKKPKIHEGINLKAKIIMPYNEMLSKEIESKLNLKNGDLVLLTIESIYADPKFKAKIKKPILVSVFE